MVTKVRKSQCWECGLRERRWEAVPVRREGTLGRTVRMRGRDMVGEVVASVSGGGNFDLELCELASLGFFRMNFAQ